MADKNLKLLLTNTCLTNTIMALLKIIMFSKQISDRPSTVLCSLKIPYVDNLVLYLIVSLYVNLNFPINM